MNIQISIPEYYTEQFTKLFFLGLNRYPTKDEVVDFFQYRIGLAHELLEDNDHFCIIGSFSRIEYK